MSDGVAKGRRWILWLLAVAGLLIGTPVAWRYRPMSETERLLVGTWAYGTGQDRGRIEFTRGRRVVAMGGGQKTLGAWHTSDGKLFVSYDLPFPQTWSQVTAYLTQVISRDHGLDIGPMDVEFEGTTRIRIRYQPTDASGTNEGLVLQRDP